ncbi:MAG: zinc metallopeptidase [Bacteroidales bacterium]|nr:zinc metallopeptidase [Bacteroidales bacterium]
MAWLLFILVMIASYIVQMVLSSRINKYSQVATNLTGAQIAQMMLEANGIHDVSITCISGTLTDHYNPQTRTVNLSENIYNGRNLAAAAIAAHECGHVIQHATGYAPLKLRTAAVPLVSFASKSVQWILLLGILLINVTPMLLWLGIALFAITTLFSFITLPVEVNASQRAVEWLNSANITDSTTTAYAHDALKWAAYTYVTAALGSLATLLYYISMARRN